ncbi:hypothetical protein VIGAN_07136100 [Vigna angularis var. angularis]|uniref:Uncharacterized protein n=1 Tax=Vigna angularis var. angularis TaxID=157739 RepID=A0A0S3SIJ5_PHAAN|nr:hypothetical protein VIGAN_07136100 [Vigna angularis var. angularis]
MDQINSFLQQLHVICNSCVNFTKKICMSTRHMKALKQLNHLSKKVIFICKTVKDAHFVHILCKMEEWEFGLLSCLSQRACIFLDCMFDFFLPFFLYYCLLLIFLLGP